MSEENINIQEIDNQLQQLPQQGVTIEGLIKHAIFSYADLITVKDNMLHAMDAEIAALRQELSLKDQVIEQLQSKDKENGKLEISIPPSQLPEKS